MSTMTGTGRTIDAELTLHVQDSIEIAAPIERAFQALLEQMGPACATHQGDGLSMRLEAWPGGRWYRDLGDDNGHLWGHVQVIKRPTLLEITGPLFMSYPVSSHVQYRLTEIESGTRLSITHRAVGMIEPAHREGVVSGWASMLQQVRSIADAG